MTKSGSDAQDPALRGVLIRMDRLGDLVLTLPMDQHPQLKSSSLTWFINQNNQFVLEASVPHRKFLGFDMTTEKESFAKMRGWLRENQPKWAVIFHAPRWVYWALWLERVEIRGGPLSRWYSWVLLNRGVRQKRSQADRHEFEFNQRLLEQALGLQKIPTLDPLKLAVPSVVPPVSGRYVVIHPGMGGSARNWPAAHYQEAVERVIKRGVQVKITGTPLDEVYLNPLREKFSQNTSVEFCDGKLSGQQLLQVLSNADGVLAPSTGVIHLAASLGVRAVGIYSPVKVQAPRRWGPRGPSAQFLVSSVECPGHFSCLMQKCSHFDCMERIRPDEAVRLLLGDL